MKNVLQNCFDFFWIWILQVDPKKEIRIRQQGRHQKHINVFGVQPALICESKGPNHFSPFCDNLTQTARPWDQRQVLFARDLLYPTRSWKTQALWP